MDMIFKNYDRIVFAGDSVTDMGSAQPVGEGLNDNVDRSYSRNCTPLGTSAPSASRQPDLGDAVPRDIRRVPDFAVVLINFLKIDKREAVFCRLQHIQHEAAVTE